MSLANVKAHLFTIDGILITLFHLFMTVGAITCVVFFRTEVMGLDPFSHIAAPTKGGK